MGELNRTEKAMEEAFGELSVRCCKYTMAGALLDWPDAAERICGPFGEAWREALLKFLEANA
ncbi:MAG: hypothetical protein ACI3WR_04690 [Oscillospiraceae bacterium]